MYPAEDYPATSTSVSIPGFVDSAEAWTASGTWVSLGAGGVGTKWLVPHGQAIWVFLLVSHAKWKAALWEDKTGQTSALNDITILVPSGSVFGTKMGSPFGDDPICDASGCTWDQWQSIRYLQSVILSAKLADDKATFGIQLGLGQSYAGLKTFRDGGYPIGFAFSPAAETSTP